MTGDSHDLDQKEERFVATSRQSVSFAVLWVVVGLIFLLLGAYLSLWSGRVFFDIDRIFSSGKIAVVLREVQAHQPVSDAERFQQVLVNEAYTRFIPTLFSSLGNCALVWGIFLILFIRIQAQWIKIVDKLDKRSHFKQGGTL